MKIGKYMYLVDYECNKVIVYKVMGVSKDSVQGEFGPLTRYHLTIKSAKGDTVRIVFVGEVNKIEEGYYFTKEDAYHALENRIDDQIAAIRQQIGEKETYLNILEMKKAHISIEGNDDSEKTFSQLEKGDYIYAIENNYVLAKYKINHIYQDVYSYYSQAVGCLRFVLENRISDIYIPKCNTNSVHSEIFYTSLDLAVSDFKKALNKN